MLRRPLEIAGYRLEPGITVAASVWLAHRRPELYPDPSAFRPERFVDGKPSPFAYLPFGGGHRRCLGAAFAQFELKVVLAQWLRRARFSLERADPPLVRIVSDELFPIRGPLHQIAFREFGVAAARPWDMRLDHMKVSMSFPLPLV